MAHITSKQNPRIKALIKIKNKPNDLLLIEGLHLIEMAYAADLVVELFSEKPISFDVETTLITPEISRKLSDKVTSDGHFALIKRPGLNPDRTKHLLYLDDVSDPGNMGTLLRTALAFDFGGVLLSPNSVDAYNPKVLAAAQGAHFHLPIKTLKREELVKLKKDGYKLLVTSVSDTKPFIQNKAEKYIIVLGNEARGVSSAIADLADAFITIPMQNIDSLNVAIAGAIIMYKIANNI